MTKIALSLLKILKMRFGIFNKSVYIGNNMVLLNNAFNLPMVVDSQDMSISSSLIICGAYERNITKVFENINQNFNHPSEIPPRADGSCASPSPQPSTTATASQASGNLGPSGKASTTWAQGRSSAPLSGRRPSGGMSGASGSTCASLRGGLLEWLALAPR